MKTLFQHITEGLYNNLGIDTAVDKELLRDWLLRYSTSFGAPGDRILTRNTGAVSIVPTADIRDFVIRTEPESALVPDGVLPEYCKDITFTKSPWGIAIWSDSRNPLKTLDNIPNQILKQTRSIFTINIEKGVINDLDFSAIGDIELDLVVTLTQAKIRGQLKNIGCLDRLTVMYDDLNDVVKLFNSFKNVKTTRKFYVRLSNINGNDTKVTGDVLSDYVTAITKAKMYDVNPTNLRHYKDWDSSCEWGVKPKSIIAFDYFAVGDMKFLKDVDPKKINVIGILKPETTYSIDELRLLPKGVILALSTIMKNYRPDVGYFTGLPKNEFNVVNTGSDILIIKK